MKAERVAAQEALKEAQRALGTGEEPGEEVEEPVVIVDDGSEEAAKKKQEEEERQA